jgi:hypothetical protein
MDYQFLRIKCARCQDELIRIKQPKTDMAVCPTCFAAGEYERVARGGGLSRSVFVTEEMKGLIERLSRQRPLVN